MRYQQLMILVTLATFAAVSTAAAAGVALFWPGLAASLSRLSAATRARLLVVLRLAPVAVALLACAVTLLAFLRHEPHATVETPGDILIAGAAAGIGLAVMGLWRLIVRCRATFRFRRMAARTATRVTIPGASLPVWRLDAAFPLVALAGIWRPHVLIARCVLEQVPDNELQVILKHEIAHARRHDNLVRLLLTGLPDVLSLIQQRVGIERAWHETAEDAADDLATGDDAQRRVCLAAGLVQVARMAGGQVAPAVPLFAFHEGESVARRVRRLLDAAQPRSIPPILLVLMTVALTSTALGLWLRLDLVLLGVHHATEWLVNGRP
jgi:Zn-dependent protease with chaperone function